MPKGPQSRERSHWLEPPRWWRRVRPLRWLLGVGALALAAHALGLFDPLRWQERPLAAMLSPGAHPDNIMFTRVAVGVTLVDRFRSYADPAAVLETLSSNGYGETLMSTRRAPDSSRYPMYRFDTVTVEDYHHFDTAGELSLQFFNNRLYEAEFVPSDPRQYARRLRRLDLKREANARAEKIDGHLRVVSTVDLAVSAVGSHLGTRPYVLWQDLRLIDERRLWDEKFGAIPKRFVSQ